MIGAIRLDSGGIVRFGYTPRGSAIVSAFWARRGMLVIDSLNNTLRFGFTPSGSAPTPPAAGTADENPFFCHVGRLMGHF